jgi:MFS transporter, putative metabolite:H+ symporter
VERHRVLDGLVLAGAAAYVATGLLVGFVLWPGVARSLGDASAFADGFARLNALARALITGLGVFTSVTVLVALVREGGIAGRRGRLRLLAIAALIASGLVGALGLEPATHAVLEAARGAAGSLPDLLARWNTWRVTNLVLGLVALTVLVIAHRSPIVVSESAAVLTSHHRTLLLLLGTATLFEGYDRFILVLALPYIAKDLGIVAADVTGPAAKAAAEGALGWALSAIRGGALLAIPLCLMADRVGRRGILLLTVLGYTAATALTGMSRGLGDLIALQLVATMFLTAELALAQVVIAEEFPAAARGLGQGLLGAAAAVGAGLAAALFPVLVATSLGWRGLYFVGIIPLLIVGYLRRSLPETRRWSELDDAERRSGGLLRVLVPGLRGRFLILVALAMGATASFATAFSFASYRAIDTFGWTPEQVSTMILTAGGLGFWGWIFFGRLSDAIGRRPTAIIALLGAAVAIAAFYRTPVLFPSFAALVFFESGITIAVTALSTECFPTVLRATARAWVTNAGVIGAVLGLGLVGALSGRMGGHAAVVALLGLLPLVLTPLLLLLPETFGRELEQVSGEVEVTETPAEAARQTAR